MKKRRHSDFDFDVHSREQLAAAVKAMAQPSYVAAREHPGCIKCGSTTYDFPNGITQGRADKIVRLINRTPKGAFHVAKANAPVVQPSQYVRELPSKV